MPSTRDIEPAATLPPPIIGTDVPDSAPGVPQPQYKSGSATSPATPIPITGSPIIPPPTISDPVGYPTFPPTGTGTAPVAVPIGPEVGPAIAAAAVPPSIAGQTQPQYKTGSATSPTAASLFPSLSAPGPSPPIILANTMQIGPGAPPFTAGTQPIIISNVAGIPQLAWANNTPPVPNPLPYHKTFAETEEIEAAAHEALAEHHEERAEHHEERAAHHGARAAHHGANKSKKKR